jgi:hypothetical protein
MEKKISVQQKFTRAFMRKHRGCYIIKQLNQCSFMQGSGPITLEAILSSEIPLEDKFWFVCKKLAKRKQNQQIIITTAEMVLPIYERRYPDDARVRRCMEAAKKYLNGEIELDELRVRRLDAYTAFIGISSYYATYVIQAAIDAANAATAANNEEASAHAASGGAAVALAASSDEKIKQQLFEYLKSVCLP